MKRLLSVLLCALLVCAFAPIAASAIGYIYEVDITGVDAPVAGELPDTEVSVNEQCDAEVIWYDRTDKCEHDLSKPFKAGHSYQVIVTLTPHEGLLFNYDTSDYDILDITATINGESASVTSSYGGEIADVFKNYDELSQIIKEVSIDNLTEPAIGATPDFSLTFGTGYTLYPTDGITWYDYTDSKALTSSDKFVTGHEYGLVIIISAGQGYEFKVNGNRPVFDAKIGNLETSVNWYYPQDPKKVASIAVEFGIIPSNVTEPTQPSSGSTTATNSVPTTKPIVTNPVVIGPVTPIAAGASVQEAEKYVLSLKNDNDPAGSVFNVLAAKAVKVTKKSIKIKWNNIGAAKYIVYGNKCGNIYQKIATVTKNSFKQAKLKKGEYYKYLIVAVDKDGKVITTSKTIHVATKGGKVGNTKSITTKATKNQVSLTVNKTFKLKSKAIAQSKKLNVKKHRPIKYETTNTNVATVSAKGVIKAKAKGTCYVYAYAQNGVCKKIKVIVK